jgi:hypothetical protein
LSKANQVRLGLAFNWGGLHVTISINQFFGFAIFPLALCGKIRHGRRAAGDSTMNDQVEGTLDGWPVSLQIQRDIGGSAYGAHCAAYAGENDEESPISIQSKCYDITDACDGLKPSAALRKAKSMGFIPDQEA